MFSGCQLIVCVCPITHSSPPLGASTVIDENGKTSMVTRKGLRIREKFSVGQ